MWSGICTSKLVIRRYMTAASPNENPHTIMVILMGVSLEPDPQKNWKGAPGKQGRVEVYTVWNVRNF